MSFDYQLALTNVPFDNSYQNVIRFNNRAEQEAYFNVNTLFANAPEVNFKVGTLFNTILPSQIDTNLNDKMSFNYAIVKDNNVDAKIKYYYYHILPTIYKGGDNIDINLELDVFQTYDLDIEYQDCMIEKAHLNRFIDNGNGTVSFDGTISSQLFETENLGSYPKRLVKREQLKLNQTGTEEVDQWLYDNVIGWVYVYTKLNYAGKTNSLKFIFQEGSFDNCYGILCYPILKGGKTFSFNEVVINSSSVPLSDDPEVAFYISAKLSPLMPFNTSFETKGTYSLTETMLSITGEGGGTEFANNIRFYEGKSMLVYRQYVDQDILSDLFNTNKQFTFNKNEIINANLNPKFNPKLLSQEFSSLRVTNTINGYDYDIQKINKPSMKFKATEAFTPDITRQYVRYNSTSDNEIYSIGTTSNYTGDVTSTDNSIPYSIGEYDLFMSQNKNFYQQRDLQTAVDIGKTAFNTISNVGNGVASAVTGNPLGLLQSANAMGSAFTSGIDIANQRIQSNLSLDNMRNAPEQLRNANGNVFFNLGINRCAFYGEVYECLPNELKMANDYMNQFGYTFNKTGNVKDYYNVRYYHNFIKANLQNVYSNTINISNEVRNKFKMIFSNGIRMWNLTDQLFNYDKENYENWLLITTEEEVNENA